MYILKKLTSSSLKKYKYFNTNKKRKRSKKSMPIKQLSKSSLSKIRLFGMELVYYITVIKIKNIHIF